MAHARLTGLLETLSERSSRGRSRGGRYLKPDSARRHFVIHIAYEQMQRGVLPTQHDMDMLFGSSSPWSKAPAAAATSRASTASS